MENTALKENTINTINTIGIMQEDQADSPCKKIYFCLQLMYLSDEPHKMYGLFFDLVRAVQSAAPSTSVLISKVCDYVLNDDYLCALKEACQLVGYEQKIIAKA
jgi:flagellar protein FlbT